MKATGTSAHLLLGAIAALAVFAGSLGAQRPGVSAAPLSTPLPVDPAVRSGTLDNGLRYYVRANGRPEKRAELRLVVNAGSILEDDDQRGLAHFVEHMAFNGTRNFSKSAIVDFLELAGMRFGADVNASTSFDETIYMLQLPTDSAALLMRGLEILEDWAHGVTFDSAEVEKERGVVIEEWRGGRGAAARISDVQLPVLLHDSKYAVRLPIGTEQSLRTFTHSALKRFYADWYRPDLMAVIAVGDFDAAAMEARIRQQFSRIPRPSSPRTRAAAPVPDHDSTLVVTATDPEETTTTVSVFFKNDARSTRTLGDYRTQVAEALLDGMLNERYQEIAVKPNAPFVYAYGGQGGLVRTKEAYTIGVAPKDSEVERALEAALLETERLARFGFTEGELSRAKANMLRGMEQAHAERERTNSAAFAGEYVRAFLDAEPFPGIEAEYEMYKRFIPEISVAELNAMAGQLLPDRNRVVMVSAAESEKGKLPSSAQIQRVFAAAEGAALQPYADNVVEGALVPDLRPPGRVMSRDSIPALGVTEWRMSNGARVVLRPTDFKADQILMSAFSPGGTSLASDADAFVVENAGLAIDAGGIGSFDQIALQKRLAGKAAGVSPYLGQLEEGMSATAAPADIETMMELLYLYFTAPRRDSMAYEAFRQGARSMFANADADPSKAYQDTLTRVMTSYHPRVRLISGAMLDSLDLDRSIDFYRDRFSNAGDFTFVFVGNFSVDSLRPLVERYIGSLPSTGRMESWRDNGVRPPEGIVTRVVRRGIEPRSETALVFTGPAEYTRANRFAINALGEILNIRLREVLREDLGGTYGVSAGGSVSRDPWSSYSFAIQFSAAPDRIESLVNSVFSEIDSVRVRGARQQDVDKVKETLRRNHETNMRENGYWLGQLTAYYRLGEDPRQLLSYNEIIDTLTPALVRDAAVRYLRSGNYIRVTLVPAAPPPG